MGERETVHIRADEGLGVRTGRKYRVVVRGTRCPCCDQHALEARNLHGEEEATRADPEVIDLETGLLKTEKASGKRVLFPLPFQMDPDELKEKLRIGCGFSDYQRYGDDELPFIHAGIDFRVPKWTGVYAVRPGEMEVHVGTEQHSSVTVFETLDGKRIGRRWEYAHIDPDHLRRVESGEKVGAGSYLGCVARWFQGHPTIADQIDVADGKLYNHLHLNMVVTLPDGTDRYYDALRYMDFPDEIDPTIVRIHLLQDGTSRAFAGDVPVVSGKVDVAVEAYDRSSGWQKEEDGELAEQPDGAPFRLGVYRAAVDVAPADERTEPKLHIDLPAFDRLEWLGGGAAPGSRTRTVYLDELTEGDDEHTARGDRFKRQSWLVVTNAVADRPDAAGSWDTTKFPDGEYRVTVTVADTRGNETSRSRTVRVKNG